MFNPNKDTRIVVLAGGQGSRFWPVSRKKCPKQFLSVSDGESLLQATVRRVSSLVDKGNVWVLSNKDLEPLVNKHAPGIRVLCEPSARNTAAAIGLAAAFVAVENPDNVLVVLPADHAVKKEAGLCQALSKAIKLAGENDLLVTIGIPASSPHTGYGYIKKGKNIGDAAYTVDRFFEKPSEDRARHYLESGGFFWNSGMFAWKAKVILKAIADYMPDLHRRLVQIQTSLAQRDPKASSLNQAETEIFNSAESTSIDFGVIEHARNCAVIEATEFGWSDVGSWDAWAEHFQSDKSGNLSQGDALLVESEGCIVSSTGKLIAVLGAKDLVVIDSGDALLVCPRDSVQEVRKVVDELKRQGRTDVI